MSGREPSTDELQAASLMDDAVNGISNALYALERVKAFGTRAGFDQRRVAIAATQTEIAKLCVISARESG